MNILQNLSKNDFLELYYKLNPSYPRWLSQWELSSLSRRVGNLFSVFFNLYFSPRKEIPVQNTLTSKFFKNLTLTKKKMNILMSLLIRSNPGKKILIVLFPELHSCWKTCHWKNGVLSTNWSNHNRNLCKCFPN